MSFLDDNKKLMEMEKELAKKAQDPYITTKDLKAIFNIQIGMLYFIAENTRKKLVEMSIELMINDKKDS